MNAIRTTIDVLVIRCLCGEKYTQAEDGDAFDCLKCGAHLEKASDGIYSAFVDTDTYPFHKMPYRSPAQWMQRVKVNLI